MSVESPIYERVIDLELFKPYVPEISFFAIDENDRLTESFGLGFRATREGETESEPISIRFTFLFWGACLTLWRPRDEY